MANRAAMVPDVPVPTSLPVWKIKMRHRGLLKASCTAWLVLGLGLGPMLGLG